ncbi:MAG: glycoside hydrolase family 3 N-terminal domain-containing protein [Bacteroidota bacterium]
MRNNLLQITVLSLFFLVFSGSHAGFHHRFPDFVPAFPELPPFLQADADWVDSIMNELSLDERIAQMIMVYAYSNQGAEHEKSVIRQISRYEVGGILFFQGSPVEQARLTNRFQESSKVPLLIAIDGENGLGMRLDKTLTYPPTMILGAISDNSLIYRLGNDMADQFRRLGVHMNFAPVADINNNPSNPVIGTRSFGEERRNVSDKVIALMKGMQDHGLLVAAKHFPGHGDTGTDSHKALPVIPHSLSRLDSIELYPFREAIRRGLTGIMVAHLQVPALDPRENRATTLSSPTITGLLKEQMEFRGLIITDALNMKGLSNYFEPGVREVEAVKAGNDILLMPSDVGKTIAAVKRAVRKGEISEEEVNKSCRKILQAKYWAGLHNLEPVKTDSLIENLNEQSYSKLYHELVEHALTLVRNRDGILPLSDLPGITLATVTIAGNGDQDIAATTDLYLEGTHYSLSSSADYSTRSELLVKLKEYNTVIVNVLNTSSRASRGYGISEGTARFIEQLDTTGNLILNVAGYPYALSRFSSLDHLDAIILSFDDDPLYQDLTAQGIFGGLSFSGRIPVSTGSFASSGEGISTGPATRLGYASPLDVGLNEDTLKKMEAVIKEAIREKAMPGCQVLVARKGKVVWHESFGYHTYQKRKPVKLTDIYDLASITKITSTLAALMRLRDQGKFHEDSLMGAYDPIPDTCNKADLLISDVLTHQSGMEAWIPFYYNTLEPLDTSQRLISYNWSRTYPLKIDHRLYANRNVKYVDGIYQKTYSPETPVEVADDLFMSEDLIDSIYHWIYSSELISREYRYSGLGFYMFHQMIEAATDTMLYPYVWHNFYAPLGAHTLGYKPLNRFPRERIVPTENDLFFRRQLLHGHVHDMGAAMLGGVSGNAGLFSCANDLAKMMQMFLNGGWYGEQRYIDSTTMAIYTSCFNCDEENRRGLGFDRPVTEEPDAGPACDDASPLSFGHSGFTGNLTWVDPEYDLVYVFLSNRIHPNQGNHKLIDMNVRTAVQQVIYDAIEEL